MYPPNSMQLTTFAGVKTQEMPLQASRGVGSKYDPPAQVLPGRGSGWPLRPLHTPCENPHVMGLAIKVVRCRQVRPTHQKKNWLTASSDLRKI